MSDAAKIKKNLLQPQLHSNDERMYWHCWWVLECSECGVLRYRTERRRADAIDYDHRGHTGHRIIRKWTLELPEPYPREGRR